MYAYDVDLRHMIDVRFMFYFTYSTKKEEKGTFPTPVVTEVENSSIPFSWAKSGRIGCELQSRVHVSLAF